MLSSRTQQQQRECEVNAREILREKAGMCVVHNKFISCYCCCLNARTTSQITQKSHTLYCTIKSRSATMNDQTIKTPQNIFFLLLPYPYPHPSSPPFAIPVPTRWHSKSWSTYIQTKATPKRRKSKEREPRVEWKRLRVERERKWINKWSFNTFHQIEREYRVPQF